MMLPCGLKDIVTGLGFMKEGLQSTVFPSRSYSPNMSVLSGDLMIVVCTGKYATSKTENNTCSSSFGYGRYLI